MTLRLWFAVQVMSRRCIDWHLLMYLIYIKCLICYTSMCMYTLYTCMYNVAHAYFQRFWLLIVCRAFRNKIYIEQKGKKMHESHLLCIICIYFSANVQQTTCLMYELGERMWRPDWLVLRLYLIRSYIAPHQHDLLPVRLRTVIPAVNSLFSSCSGAVKMLQWIRSDTSGYGRDWELACFSSLW